MNEPRMCPDCKAEMHEIKLIDKAHCGAHASFEYTLPEAKKSFWTSSYPIEGQVLAFLCPSCARIALYGATKME